MPLWQAGMNVWKLILDLFLIDLTHNAPFKIVAADRLKYFAGEI